MSGQTSLSNLKLKLYEAFSKKGIFEGKRNDGFSKSGKVERWRWRGKSGKEEMRKWEDGKMKVER